MKAEDLIVGCWYNIVYNEPGNEPWAGKAKLLNLNNPIYEDDSHQFECEDGTLGAFPSESIISPVQECEKLVEWLKKTTQSWSLLQGYDPAYLAGFRDCAESISNKLKELGF